MALAKREHIEALKNMTVMEVVDLISELEEKLGVSAATAITAFPFSVGAAESGASVDCGEISEDQAKPANVSKLIGLLEKALLTRIRRDYESFFQYLRDPTTSDLIILPKRFSRAADIGLDELARMAHVHLKTLTYAPDSKSVQGYLREALRVIKAGTDISGDVGRALFWFRHDPLSVFGYKTPEQVVSEGRTEDLLRYVASLEAGVAG